MFDPTLDPMVDPREAFENADDPQWQEEYKQYLDAQLFDNGGEDMTDEEIDEALDNLY
jgi:hypothetical protein